MGRYAAAVESQAAQLAGVPASTNHNGYFAAVVAGASQNFKVRRVQLGVRAGASVPTSQQVTVAAYRQTTRAVGGLSTVVGSALDPRASSSVATGVDVTTSPTATTIATLAANPLYRWSFNTQSTLDLPYEFLEELICDQGTANGICFVNIGNALPSAHLFSISLEWEE